MKFKVKIEEEDYIRYNIYIAFHSRAGRGVLFRGRIFGGIYDNRLLVKPVKAAKALMPGAVYELPYEGAKPMLLVEEADDRDFLCALVEAMYSELPEPKKRKQVK